MPRITSLELRQKLFPYARLADKAGDVRLPNVLDEGDRMPDLASEAWKQLTEQEKEPWREKARIVKAEHKAKYPDYRFRPIRRKKRKTKGSVIKKRDVEKDGEDPLRDAVHSIVQDAVPSTVPITVQGTVRNEVQGTNEPPIQGQFNRVIQYAPVYLPNDLYQYQVAQNLALIGGQMGMGIPPFIPLPTLPRWPGILHSELLQTNQLTSDPGLAPSWAITGLQYPRFDNVEDLPYFK
ncbi:sry-box containing 7 [Pyrrhoderma noxium]|uniref:Sry-box containing 7 n=1 Tax=Pyrrhoderma noxium TaxID=2282107 RepID=A0A286UCW9_9AGAM|nr:sry-box containing 7 [Pyrrhoderma noxium]